jgi:hypothetical protein
MRGRVRPGGGYVIPEAAPRQRRRARRRLARVDARPRERLGYRSAPGPPPSLRTRPIAPLSTRPLRPRLRRRALCALGVAAWLLPAAGARAQGAAARWSFSGSFTESHSDNLLLLPEGPSDILDTAYFRLGHSRLTPTTTLSASGWTAATLYREHNPYNGLRHGGDLSLSHRLSPRWSWSLGGSVATGINHQALYSTRVQFPQLRVTSEHVTWSLGFEATPRTLATLDASGGWYQFRSSEPVVGGQLTLLNRPAVELVPPVRAPAAPAAETGGLDASLLLLNILATEGLDALRLDASSFGGGFGLSHAFSPRLSAWANVRYERFRFDLPRAGNGGRTFAGASLRRTLGTSSTIGLSYAYQSNGAQVPRVTMHNAQATFDAAIGSRLRVDATVGGGRFSTIATPPRTVVTGGAGITTIGERTRFNVRYHRSAVLALGFGRNQVYDYASASVSRLLTQRLSATLDAGYRYSREAFVGDFPLHGQIYSATLRYALKQRTQVGADYSYRRFEYGRARETVDSSLWSVFVSYDRIWR